MLEFTTLYTDHVREIAALCDIRHGSLSFEEWYESRIRADARIRELRRENDRFLSENLFPLLDTLHDASPEQIAALEAFGDVLMDWKTNLDVGVYLLIHDSLLSLYRFRKDRNNVIKELYKLGMGLYYQNRSVQGIRTAHAMPLYFENEMTFTEAGSYLKFFDQIEDEPTKGYIIRALANIAICTKDHHKKVATSARILQIVRDEYYRSLAPGLPWDVFLRRTEQQMSSNRDVLSKGDLSAEELSQILEACLAVFEPEIHAENPNIRWLWPYYEMEYSCGFVDLKTTYERMERIIDAMPYDQYDTSGMYANVQLPIYYGRLIRKNPSLQKKKRNLAYLKDAYDKMMRTLMSVPQESIDDFILYDLVLVISDYYETDGVPTYESIALKLMERFAGLYMISALRVGELLQAMCACILKHDPQFFDDIPFLAECADPEEKEARLLDYAKKCGLFYDFGVIKMNLDRMLRTRNLFEREFRIFSMHTLSGYDDLAARASTQRYADIAYGHHSWYNDAGGYPEGYVRNDSPYRQMTDTVAVAIYLVEENTADAAAAIREAIALGGTRFSPLVTAYMEDPELQQSMLEILERNPKAYYRAVFEHHI